MKAQELRHFLASAVAASIILSGGCLPWNIGRREKRLEVGKVGLGELIKDCASDVNAWQKGGNTMLGTVMLFVPIAVAAGMTPAKKGYVFDFKKLRKNIDLAVKSTTA